MAVAKDVLLAAACFELDLVEFGDVVALFDDEFAVD